MNQEDTVEVMMTGKQAAHVFGLPNYWFIDRVMRENKRIPHYIVGSSVRYKMRELMMWFQQNCQQRK